jgi:N,N-dimethylformamidase beta subunit-like protein
MHRAAALLCASFITSGLLANPIQIENARPGTTAWQLKAGRSADIEGYASLTSVDVGGTIRFFVSTSAPQFTMDFFRMGWYGGAGSRQVFGPSQASGQVQPVPRIDPVTGLIECHWTESYRLTIPADWVSGVYVVKLTAQPDGQQNWIMFVVRDDAHTSDLLFQSSVTTMQAYNPWGGKSLYGFNSADGVQASQVSFDRPYGAGAGVTEFLRWEYPLVRFLEREGYDVSYSTNIDTHERPESLRRHRGFLSAGHDEYWSWQMRDNVESARDAGVSLGFFSSNTSYWQIRLGRDSDLNSDRTIIAYKEKALVSDPVANDGDPLDDYLTTTSFRSPPANRAEEAMIGSMWASATGPVSGDIVVEHTSHWIYANTGLRDGDHLRSLLGYEVDRMFDFYPVGTERLAHSPFDNGGVTDYSDMTIYRAASGAWVFGTGSMEFAYGLDDPGTPREVAPPAGGWVSPAAQQIARNVLNAFVARNGERRRAVGRR